MCNVIEFWQQREECIKNLLLQFSESASTQFNRGCVCLLKRLQWETELYHSQATTHFPLNVMRLHLTVQSTNLTALMKRVTVILV